jgi:sarcosine oxidase subunit gamma
VARKGAEARLSDRVRQVFELELPKTPLHASSAAIAFAWAGPSQWLALAERVEAPAFELRLRSSLAGDASVIDQSDGRTIFRISGPYARKALSKGIHIDLHPRTFKPGCVAITAVSNIITHFWQTDAAPTYEFAVFRSFAGSFCEWILDAAAEFNVWAKD